MARHFEQKGRTAAELKQQAPWWIVSFVIHAILLFALSYMQFAGPPVRKKKIKVQTDFVEIVEKMQPLRKRNVFNQKSKPRAGGFSPSFNKAATVSKSLPVMTVSNGNISASIAGLFGKGNQDFGLGGLGGGLAAVQDSAPQTYDEALDVFALDTIEVAKKRRILVVLLVDQSRSLFDDRKSISAKIDSILDTIGKETSAKERSHIRWAIVSFGANVQICMRPNKDLKKIKQKIMAIAFDTSGKENLLKAIRYTLQRFAKPKQWSLFIALISDEPGDDTKGREGEKLLLSTLSQLKMTKTRLYTFGSEANFSFPRVWCPVYDEDGRVVDYNWADGGPAAVERELLPFSWRFNPSACRVPSGFGMYAQTYLSHYSGGTYFILTDAPSRYDDTKLEKDFAPEMISPSEYLRRRAKSEIRRKLDYITTEWGKKYLSLTIWFGRLDHLNEDALVQIKKAQEAHKWVREARRSLEHCRRKDKWKPIRWQANRDLTIAQLARLQFNYRQYWIAVGNCVKNGWPFPTKGEKYNYMDVRYDKKTDRPPGGRLARKEMREAEQLLRKVAEDYKETPWATLATKDLGLLKPYRVQWIYYESHKRAKL